jgi:hypothetical protein
MDILVSHAHKNDVATECSYDHPIRRTTKSKKVLKVSFTPSEDVREMNYRERRFISATYLEGFEPSTFAYLVTV